MSEQVTYIVEQGFMGISGIKVGEKSIALSPTVGAVMGQLKGEVEGLEDLVEELGEEIAELRTQLAAVNVPPPTQKNGGTV